MRLQRDDEEEFRPREINSEVRAARLLQLRDSDVFPLSNLKKARVELGNTYTSRRAWRKTRKSNENIRAERMYNTRHTPVRVRDTFREGLTSPCAVVERHVKADVCLEKAPVQRGSP